MGTIADNVRYTNALVDVDSIERSRLISSSLYKQGDIVLIWANKGDLLEYGMLYREDTEICPTTGMLYDSDELPLHHVAHRAPSAQSFSGGPLAENEGAWPSLGRVLKTLTVFVLGAFLGAMALASLGGV